MFSAVQQVSGFEGKTSAPAYLHTKACLNTAPEIEVKNEWI